MKNLIVPLVVSTLLLSACGAPSSNQQASASATHLMTNCDFNLSASQSQQSQLPDVSLPCLTSRGYSNDQTSLSSLKGPMVLNLWGSWCPPCREEMPLFRELYLTTRQSKQLSIVGIDVEDSAKDALKFMAEQGMDWPQLADTGQKTRPDFGMGVPVTWFVDAQGRVTYRQVGQINSWAQMLSLIEAHLGIKIAS